MTFEPTVRESQPMLARRLRSVVTTLMRESTVATTQIDSVDGWKQALGIPLIGHVLAIGNNEGASVDDVFHTLIWSTPRIADTTGGVSVSGSNITALRSGVFEFHVSARTDNGNRTELFVQTYKQALGSGEFVEQTDDIASCYVSRDSDQDTGGVTLSTKLQLAATDVIQFRAFGDTDSFSTLLDPGTILSITAFT